MTETDRATLRTAVAVAEGEVLHAYQDALGYWTIGCGHLIDARVGGGIPREVSQHLLNLDLAKAETACMQRIGSYDSLDGVRQRALVELAFNLGIGGLVKFSRMLAALDAHDFETAANELHASLWYGQVGPSRGSRLVTMIRTGRDPA